MAKGKSKNKCMFLALKPKDVSEEAWVAVIEAWENGLSDREASFRASRESGVMFTATDIKKWIKENPEIGELRGYLQDDLISTAKITVSKSLKKGDIKTAKWYLERKASEEFSTKSAVAFEGGVIELSLEDKEKALNDLVAQFEAGKSEDE